MDAWVHGSEVHLAICHNAGGNQEFTYTTTNEVKIFNLCLDGPENDGPTFSKECHKMGGTQKWIYNNVTGTLSNVNGRCLTQIEGDGGQATIPMLRLCDGSAAQRWRMDRSFVLP